ncbi:Variant-specific surface protein [Giardia duodenalis]|uniref:Variant-specific surface protein n=1 Tax=Giardia intestinalis TaxID=5741 RepID=V6U1R4_GIAIN|nr:Variant-specific surface protein [Giardia intestinalis]
MAPRAGPATHRSPASAAHTALLRDRCTSRRPVNQRLKVGHSSSPGSQTRVSGTLGARVACTGRGSRPRRSGQGRPGCTRMGLSGSRHLWGSAVLGDSAWWTLLLLLQPLLHRCSVGQFLFMGGCYNARAAPGSGVCREARDGECVGYAEESIRGIRETKETRAHGTSAEARGARVKVSTGTETRRQTDSGQCAVGTNGCAECDSSSTACARCEAGKRLEGSQCVDGIGVPLGRGLTADPKQCTNSQQCSSSGNNCLDVTIGGSSKEVCTKCEDTHVPIDGVCTDKTNTNGKCTPKNDGTCTACSDPYYLYSGGCYATCPDGTYADSSTRQCASCDGTCKTCSAAGDSKCKSCRDGYFLGAANNAAGKCIQCSSKDEAGWPGVDNCAKCTSSNAESTPAVCTECADNYYLKTVQSTTSCETNCGEGFFATTVENVKKCVSCSTTENGGIENCAKCSLKASSARAGAAVTCTECGSGKKLSPLKDACLDTCPAGTYDSSNVCTPCHTSCAECNGNANQDSCTACYPGHVLNKTDSLNTGTCIPECTGRYAENCEAGMCTAVLGGSKYCSKCAVGYAPIDGVCTAVATTSRDTSGCTASDGVCTACTGANYALLSGGCYNTKALPGSAVCTQAGNNGQCTTCANGQSANSGVCPACAEGCANCKTGVDKCDTCYSGYYLSGTSCVKCTENSNSIQGIKDCVSCKEPSGGSGPVTCYVTQEPTVDPAGPSVNKGGLSSGAIAGISVAVIVVVGGLVGFLCWWFVCRGKA